MSRKIFIVQKMIIFCILLFEVSKLFSSWFILLIVKINLIVVDLLLIFIQIKSSQL